MTTVANDLRITPQARTVLAHLKRNGSISNMEAQVIYSISRLAACIYEIRRRAGYTVESKSRRDDYGHKYTRYSLEQPALVH
jgi:hypothetical protein